DLAREPGGGNRNVRKLIHGGFRNDAAISHEQQAAFAEAGVLDFHDHATGGGGGGGSHFDDLKERAQHTAGDMAGAGNETIGLVHRHHHGPVIVGVEHGVAGFLGFEPLR